tara:strand:+ start:452 stop:586 length:135 start_codon:yes stop_codon:yes gene_type:complete
VFSIAGKELFELQEKEAENDNKADTSKEITDNNKKGTRLNKHGG